MNRWMRVSLAIALCGASLSCSSDGLLIPIAPPALSAISMTAVMQGATATVALTGTNFVPGATTVVVSGAGITVSSVTVTSPTSASASLVIAPSAPIGARTVAVVTVAGTSAAVTLMVNPPPPTLATMLPAVGVQGTTVPVTLTGTNFVTGATTIAVSGTGVSVRNVSVTNATIVTADFFIDAGATLADRTVTAATAGGTSSPQTFTIKAPPPTLASLSAATGVTGTIVTQTLTGTNFIAGATVVVSGSGITVTNVAVVSATSITVQFTLSADAALGARSVTVLTSGGVSGAATFTVNPPAPTVGGIAPNSGVRGTAVAVTISGTNFVAGATTVAVSGTGVTVGAVNVASATSLTTTLTIDETATLGDRTVTITTAGGAGATQTFTVLSAAPTLTSVSPAASVRGQAPAVTLIGSNFVPGATSVSAGAGVTVLNVSVTSSTSLTAIFSVDPATALGDRAVTVSTAGGTSNQRPFTVLASAPLLASVVPNTGAQGGTRTVTLTGTNFLAGATSVNVSGGNVTVGNINVLNATTATADLVTGAGAAVGARNVTVTTAGGTTGPQNFTVIVGPSITSFAALATHLTLVQPVAVAWATSNASSCSITAPFFNVACTGSGIVTPGTNTTYTLTASSAGASVQASSPVFVNEPGRWVFSAAKDDDQLRMFSFNASTGNLTPIGGGTVGVGAGNSDPTSVAVDPAGKYAYAVNNGSTNISMYLINSTTGALTSNGQISASGTNTQRIAVDPTGRFAYVVNAGPFPGNGNVNAYSINGSGQLVALNGGVALPAGTQPVDLTIDPLGRFVYVANSTTNDLSIYSINANGGPTSDGTLTFVGTQPQIGAGGVAADPSGRFLYATTRAQGAPAKVIPYAINSNGTLTAGTPIDGSGTMGAIAVDPTGRFVFALDVNNSFIWAYKINLTTGNLTAVNAPLTGPAPNGPNSLAVDPQGQFVYTTNSIGTISIFSIDQSTGAVALVNTIAAAGTNPRGIVVSR